MSLTTGGPRLVGEAEKKRETEYVEQEEEVTITGANSRPTKYPHSHTLVNGAKIANLRGNTEKTKKQSKP